MKSVSAAFKNAHASPSSVSLRRVSYKRRYWDQPTQKFIWEGSWTTLSESEVVSVSAITAKLDTDAVNEFKISNLTITLKNADRRWTSTNPFGLFGKDSASPVNGYEPYWTKFRIETGYVVSGVDTYVTMFVGVAVDFKTEGNSDTMQIDVQGLEALLQNANAEEAGVYVENETVTGTADGVNKDFYTVQPGVGVVLSVTINSSEVKAGTDYSLAEIENPKSGAKISFSYPPASGSTIRASYRYYRQNQSIEDNVKDLLSVVGFTSSDWTIDTVTFPGDIYYQMEYGGAIDFSQSTLNNISLTHKPGYAQLDPDTASNKYLLDDFNDGNYTGWNVQAATNGSFSVTGNRLRFTPTTNGASGMIIRGNYTSDTPFDRLRKRGCFTFDAYFSGIYTSLVISLSKDQPVSGTDKTESGFVFAPSLNSIMYFHRLDDGSISYRSWHDAKGLLVAGSLLSVKIIRYPYGYINVSVNGTVLVSDKFEYDQSPKWFVVTCYTPYSVDYIEIDNVYLPELNLTADVTSPVIDLRVTPTAFGNAFMDADIPPGDQFEIDQLNANPSYGPLASIAYSTNTSADGSTWDGWVAMTGSSVINSTPRRYMKLKADLTLSSANGHLHQHDILAFAKATIPYKSNSAIIKLPKYTGKTVYDAISSFGAFCNYEWGFGSDEKFFFRSKSANTSIDETLSSSSNIVDASDIRLGTDRVFDSVSVSYGDNVYKSKVSGTDQYNITKRYGHKEYNATHDDMLLDSDVNIAENVSKQLLSYYSKPRRTCKVRTKLMEWIDLSDTVSVTFRDKPVNWWIGDTQVYLGQTDIYLHGPESNTLDGFVSKVVGYRHDTEGKTSEFDLEEIVQ